VFWTQRRLGPEENEKAQEKGKVKTGGKRQAGGIDDYEKLKEGTAL